MPEPAEVQSAAPQTSCSLMTRGASGVQDWPENGKYAVDLHVYWWAILGLNQ